MKLHEYLNKYHQPATVKVYAFEIKHYLQWMSETRAQQADYAEVMRYLVYLRDRYQKPATISRIIQAIKRYYYYLQDIGLRNDHPCRHLRLRDTSRKEIQLQDLLKPKELERLLTREERFASYTLRNRVIMSLLVYQALLTREIVGLKVQDVQLEKATIYIRQTSKTNARTLPLQAEQVMLLHWYLTEVRPQLVKAPSDSPEGERTNRLVITGRGTPEQGEGILYLVTTFRKDFPGKRLTPMTIRQSVIAAKLKQGQDLRLVQAFAGHRQPSTTELYRTNQLEELKVAVQKYHPLQANIE